MPRLFSADPRIEREAARVYFGENTFELSKSEEIDRWAVSLRMRHRNQIRKIVVREWPVKHRQISSTNDAAFRKLGTLRNLSELAVAIDEREAISQLLLEPSWISQMSWHSILGYGLQVQLQLLYLDGIDAFRAMRGLRTVSIAPFDNELHPKWESGAIPRGVLETVKREMVQSRETLGKE